MNLCRCERGHFFDKEKYVSCPHCVGGSASDEKRTEAFVEDLKEDFTIPLEQSAGNLKDDVTIPLSGADRDVMQNQVSSAFSGFKPDTPTEPLDGIFSRERMDVSGIHEEADDHTVGFFDEIFPGSLAAAEKSSAGQPVPKTVGQSMSNKVDTPCVGWLIALSGAHIGTDFRLKVGKNFIGRSLQMDVALTEDKSVSRESHAILIYEPKAHIYLVQPGESSSLVYRNNELLLTPMKLETYDVITVGEVDLMFMPLCGERFNWEDVLKKMKDKNG